MESGLYPRLLAGIARIDLGQSPLAQEHTFYLGDQMHGLHLPIALSPIVPLLDGVNTVGNIAEKMGIELDLIARYLTLFEKHGLIALSQRPSEPAPTSQERLLNWHWQRAELAFEEHRQSPLAAGDSAGALEQRAALAITIHGANRLAWSMLSLLLASGFTGARLHHAGFGWARRSGEAKFPNRPVPPELLTSLPLKQSHLGRAMHKVEEELRQEILGTRNSSARHSSARNSSASNSSARHSSASNSSEVNSSYRADVPAISITTELLTPEFAQLQLANETAHLPLRFLTPYLLSVGPLVLPGISACTNCARLVEADGLSNELRQSISIATSDQFQPSAANLQFAAAIVVQELSSLCAIGSSALIGQVFKFDLRRNISDQPLPTRIDIQSACGCQDLISELAS